MTESLYNRIGGEPTIAACVADFYGRVLGDPDLSPFFHGTSMEKLVRMQREFFVEALGGPSTYSGIGLRDAHAGRNIGPRQLARFSEHLLETLRSQGLDSDDIQEIVHRIALHAEDVTGLPSTDG